MKIQLFKKKNIKKSIFKDGKGSQNNTFQKWVGGNN